MILRRAVTHSISRRTWAHRSLSSAAAPSVDAAELDKFRHISDAWWDPSSTAGSGPLHSMNILRTRFIADCVSTSSSSSQRGKPLQGLRCLDVGCGGGLLSESLARLGGQVTAIDPSAENVAVAVSHAQGDPLTRDNVYEAAAAEQLAERGEQFDVVCALEVVEHVNNVGDFVATLCTLVRPGGHLVMSTLNRTSKSYALAIVGAEYIARLLPAGTHDWNKFVTPRELMAKMRTGRLQIQRSAGMVYSPLACDWKLDEKDLDVNYIVCAKKPGGSDSS